jgi:hypothetical protein
VVVKYLQLQLLPTNLNLSNAIDILSNLQYINAGRIIVAIDTSYASHL